MTPEVWQRAQDVLTAQNHAGTRQREHNHYLKGTVFCGDCGSRLIISKSRGRAGKVYPYYVCSGRHNKFTDCTFRAVLIDIVEQKVEQEYAEHRLKPALREAIERTLILEFEAVRQEAATERKRLLKRQQRLYAERDKLLQAHYAEAIPLDLLKSEQDRIRTSLSQITQRLDRTEIQYNACETNLVACLKFLEDAHATYLSADAILRRQMNQALFKRIKIERNGGVRADLTETFSALLGPEVRDLVATTAETGDVFNWHALETSFNDNTHGDPVGVGLTYETLVDQTGLEPSAQRCAGTIPDSGAAFHARFAAGVVGSKSSSPAGTGRITRPGASSTVCGPLAVWIGSVYSAIPSARCTSKH